MPVIRRKALIVVGATVVTAIVIAVIAVIATQKGKSDETASFSKSKKSAIDKVSDTDLMTKKDDFIRKVISDPDIAIPAFAMLAIGDWGATIYKPGSCCNKYRKNPEDSVEYKTDYWAQANVAEILAQSAGNIKAKRIINHGDNLYWNGAGPDDILYRMENTFEEIYSQAQLIDIPWISVAGNHDLGGSEFICGDEDYAFWECESVEELVKYLNLKFSLQQTYKSPNNDRWQLRDHYFVEAYEQDGVSVNIFNIDTNKADSHGINQICCQCYGYARKMAADAAEQKKLEKTCNSQIRGASLCAGGSVELYDACAAVITSWWDVSLDQIQKDLAKCNSTWKIINSHYSPHFHMSEDKMKEWYAVTKAGGVHLWMNGHTHGFNHDLSNWGTHFIENGGGGGIQSETSGFPPAVAKKFVSNAWVAPGNPYGFFELHFSKEWLKVEFVTFDSNWVFSTELDQIVKGGQKKGHCWHIPVTLGNGRACRRTDGANAK